MLLGQQILKRFAAVGSPLRVDGSTIRYNEKAPEPLVQELDKWIEFVYAALTERCPVEECRARLEPRIEDGFVYWCCSVDRVHFGELVGPALKVVRMAEV